MNRSKEGVGLILWSEAVGPLRCLDGGMENSESQSPLRRVIGRPWALALLYLLLAVLLAAMEWAGLWNLFSLLDEPYSPWLTLLTAVPASFVVLLKRRAPAFGLVLAVLIFALDLLTFGGLVPLLVLLELMHSHLLTLDAAQRRQALGWVIALIVAIAIAAFVRSSDLRTTALLTLQFGALLGFSYWYANSIAQSRELVQLYRQRSEAAERLAVLDRESAVQGERDRMARELHDVVAGHISAVAIRSEAALSVPGAGSSAATEVEQRALRAVRDSSLEAHDALRSMIRVLRTGERDFEVPPGRERVPELVAAANDSGVRVRLLDELPREPNTSVDQAMGRIVQEALANCVRHSSGADVEVRLAERDGEVRVDVVSIGGSALSSLDLTGSGLGLELLAERVRALGGTFAAGAEDAGVWAVRARLPREEAA